MRSQIKIQQIAVFTTLTLFTAGVTTVAYRIFQEKWVLFRKAESHFRRNEYSEAVAFYEKAMASGLRSEEPLFHLAKAYEEMGNTDKAIINYRAIVAMHPLSRPARLSLARALTKGGRFEEAIDEYRVLVRK